MRRSMAGGKLPLKGGVIRQLACRVRGSEAALILEVARMRQVVSGKSLESPTGRLRKVSQASERGIPGSRGGRVEAKFRELLDRIG